VFSVAVIKGGDKLEAALNKTAANASKAATLSVGFLEGSTEPDGTSIPMIAAIQEFGAPKANIPPRPFFRNMIAAKSGEWLGAVADLLKANDYDAEKTLGQTGEAIKGQLQQSIIDTMEPALSPVTIMLRGMKSNDQSLVVNRTVVEEARARVAAGLTNYGASEKPLIDSGNLLNAVDYTVK
jgi:hypothetical protein